MPLATLRPLLLSALLVWAGGVTTVRAAPVDEIRALLASALVDPPDEQALARLAGLDATGRAPAVQAGAPDAFDAALRAIDRHARYFAADAYRSPLLGAAESSGIGARLLTQGDAVLLDVYQGGPADRAGIPDGARLLEVDGRALGGRAVQEVAVLLRGEVDSRVRIAFADGDGRRRTVTLERARFTPLEVELVEAGALPVLRIRDFVGSITRTAALATVAHLGRGRSEGAPPALVIDLRAAPGGDLYEAFDLAAAFLPQGALLGTLRSRSAQPREVRAPGGPKLDMPLALLIGPDTASAAEVFAGTLQAHGRAVLIGGHSFGKCSSQTDARLSDGSVLRFTNLEVLLPDGQSCSGRGLSPDVEVDATTLVRLPDLLRLARVRLGTEGPRPAGGG